MVETVTRIVASVVCALVFCFMNAKTVGAMQQSGYKNGVFLRWFKRKDNLFFNRLSVLALCLALSTAVTALCFSFLGKTGALVVSALPFFALLVAFLFSDNKYALKVPAKRTGRYRRLFAAYLLFTACFCYAFIALLSFLSAWNGSKLYALIAYVPFALTPVCLPALLCAANAVTGVFENARNKKFVKRAGQVLDERKILRVGVVGSYGKTSVKNILAAILSEKYAVSATPESYNTPIGIAKTVFDGTNAETQVFIAEMGARKAGDISELCRLVKPDYAVFTGVCEQHITSFGSLENVWKEKSEILRCGAKKVVCGAGLKDRLESEFSGDESVLIADNAAIEGLELSATETRFTLRLKGGNVKAETKLLGKAAAENILLAAALACEMGMTCEEIERGIAKIQPVPHRLQLLESGGAYILDDGYNCNIVGAEEALAALGRFGGGKCIVTPGIVECGVLEEEINGKLGEKIAAAGLDKVVLVGDTLVGAVKRGYLAAGGEESKLAAAKTLDEAKTLLADWIKKGDAVLFLNDLPDVY